MKDSIERVLAALYHLPVDRIPMGEFIIEKDFIKNFMLAYFPHFFAERFYPVCKPEDWLEIEIAFHHCLGLDLVCIHGVINANNIRRFNSEGLFVFLVLNGAFQSLMQQFGFTEMMTQIARHPDKTGEYLSIKSRQITSAIINLPKDINGIIIADDVAYNQGTYINPQYLEKYLLPCWKEQVNAAEKINKPVIFHSDGNINSILPYVVQAGFNGLHCIEPRSGMDIKEVKKLYGSNLCLMGNIDPDFLHDTSYERLSLAVQDLLLSASPGSGFIFGTCSGLDGSMSPESVRFMYEKVLSYTIPKK